MVGAHTPTGDQPPPFFFLSYARSKYQPEDGSDPDVWVRKLYRALCTDVHHLTSTPRPGFMDRQTPLGTRWPTELSTALAHCRVFVALLSPGYFTSEYCGKEWSAFHHRIGLHAGGGRPPVAIIPALWTPFRLDELPPEVRDIQLIPPGFPKAYADEGFFGLMKLRRYDQAYKESVLLIAKMIKNIAEQTRLAPCAPPDLGSIHNAFADHRARSGSHQVRVKLAAYVHRPDEGGPGGEGPAPDDRQAHHRARSHYFYGRSMREWAPYRDRDDSTPVARHAEQVISALGHRPVLEPLDEPADPRAAEAAPSPSVLLVDPWAAGVGDVAAELRGVDREPIHTVVPWNEHDDETTGAAPMLEQDLAASITNCLVLHGSAPRVPTVEAFRGALPKAVSEAISRHFKTAPAYPPEQPPSMERPTLRGLGP